MNIISLKSGDKFTFRGDWQTEPGAWEVIEHENDFGMTVCRPIDNPHEGISRFFSRGVTVAPA